MKSFLYLNIWNFPLNLRSWSLWFAKKVKKQCKGKQNWQFLNLFLPSRLLFLKLSKKFKIINNDLLSTSIFKFFLFPLNNSTYNYNRFFFQNVCYELTYWGLLTRLRQVTVIGDVVLRLLVWGCWCRRRWHLNRHLWVLIASAKYIYIIISYCFWVFVFKGTLWYGCIWKLADMSVIGL